MPSLIKLEGSKLEVGNWNTNYMINNLTFNEPLKKALSVLAPVVQHTSPAQKILQTLLKYLNVQFTGDELDGYDHEINTLSRINLPDAKVEIKSSASRARN